jgi:tubulin delta
MSIAFLQLGQCGNQLGSALLDAVSEECRGSSPAHRAIATDLFFHEKKGQAWANSVLVDMEPKVVERCLARTHPFRFERELSFCQQEGSGNNWAYGYFKHGPRVLDSILERMHRLLEQLDYCGLLLGLQSMAGGTGSGLGSFLF